MPFVFCVVPKSEYHSLLRPECAPQRSELVFGLQFQPTYQFLSAIGPSERSFAPIATRNMRAAALLLFAYSITLVSFGPVHIWRFVTLADVSSVNSLFRIIST